MPLMIFCWVVGTGEQRCVPFVVVLLLLLFCDLHWKFVCCSIVQLLT